MLCLTTVADAEEYLAKFATPTADYTSVTLRSVHAASNSRPWEDEATDSKDGLGLQVRRPKDNHVQFMQDGKVLAEWWPSKGTTMMDGKRGPVCATGEDVVAWLKHV